MKPDISESLVIHVDAAPAEVLGAVDRLGRDPFAGKQLLRGIDVLWDVRVEPDEHDGSYLASTRRFTPADDAAHAALLADWAAVRAGADTIARRTLRTIKRAAEHRPAPVIVPAPELLLVA
jgi:hypothetical protein